MGADAAGRFEAVDAWHQAVHQNDVVVVLADEGRGAITVHRREFRPDDLDGQFIVFGALDDPAAREALSREARRRGIPANLADDPANCDFIIPSSFSLRSRSSSSSSPSGPAVWMR